MKGLKNLIILYVENEEIILEKYSPFLKTHCDRLYIASNGKEAYSIYVDKKPHIILMDLYISKFDGMALAKKIREQDDEISLIALTECADRETLLEIIDLHFSSYLVKPVDRTDLLKALLKVSKRVKNSKNIVHLREECYWDSSSKALFYKNSQIILTKREQKLFELLVDKNGIACSENEIFFYVWEDDFNRDVTNASIRTLVKNLRKKIPKELIKNQYGVGYKINL